MTQSKSGELRTMILARRDAAAGADRGRWSRLAAAAAADFAPLAAARTVMLFASFRSEIDTSPLAAILVARGQRLAYPLSLVRRRDMALYLVRDPDRDLRPGYCGIPEPDPQRCPEVAPEEVDVVLAPGSVFGRDGGRIGYGGGFYDRFLAARAPQALRIGFAFALQVVDTVPQEPHDQRMDWLITERGVEECGKPG